MDVRHIAAFADGSLNGLARAELAARLAGTVRARLTIHVIASLPPRQKGPAAAAMDEARDEISWVARNDAGAIKTRLAARAANLMERIDFDVPSIEAHAAAKTIGSLIRTSDLAIVGGPIAADASRLDDAIVTGAVFHSGRACLVIPRTEQSELQLARVLVAWSGTREAARAMQDAMPLLTRAAAVDVFLAHGAGEDDVDGAKERDRLQRYLLAHGVEAQFHTEPAHARSAGVAILATAQALRSDLLVMGAYGHARLQELLLGGATAHVLRHMHLPVLMSH